jgi:hypothetical protein
MRSDSSSSQQLLKQFYSKVAHVIIHSRCSLVKVRFAHPINFRRTNKWFSLATPEHIRINHFVYLEILSGKTTIELYKLSFIQQQGPENNNNITTTYRNCVAFFRSLFSILRLMPAYYAKNLTYRISNSVEYPTEIQV